jgi:hypothetical protein
MNQQTKLSQKQEPLAETQTQTKAQSAREFASSDELLRADAAETAVPSEIGARLKKSAAQIQPPATRSWWKTLLGH